MVRKKAYAKLTGALAVVILLLAIKLYESIGPTVIGAIFIGIAAFFIVVRYYRAQRRRRYLMTKYRDTEIVAKVLRRDIWLGQTAEQLIDTFKTPVAVDNQQLKTKKKEIWKYDRRGANRYGLRVTLENDMVVSWDQKS